MMPHPINIIVINNVTVTQNAMSNATRVSFCPSQGAAVKLPFLHFAALLTQNPAVAFV